MAQSQSEIEYYEEVTVLNQEHKVSVVRHRENGRIFLKKIMPVYNLAVYEQLYRVPISNIPRIYALYEDKDNHTLTVIEEYISGRTLQEILDTSGPLPEATVTEYGIRLCDILNDLHKATPMIIHRDIKPSNVILTDDGRLVLIDLNAAKHCDPEKSRDTRLLGTEGYAAPEQFGFGASIPQTDLYALGVMMATLLTGDEKSRSIPDGKLSDIIRKCTKLDPADRYQNARELRSALIRSSSPIRKRMILLLSAAMLIVISAALLLFLRRPHTEQKDPLPVAEDQNGHAAQPEEPHKDVITPVNKEVSSPVGVFTGDDSDILVLAEDGLAYYYCDNPTFTDLCCPYTYTEGLLSIDLAKLHCTVFSEITNDDFSELLLRSDSGNWNAELFKKISAKPKDYLTRTVSTHNPSVTVASDGTMHFELDGMEFYVPKYYCDFYDEASDTTDNGLYFINVDSEQGFISDLVFYSEDLTWTGINDQQSAARDAQDFCERFFEEVRLDRFVSASVAGHESYICDVSGTYNKGFQKLSGIPASGKLAVILDEQNNTITYLLFTQTENSVLDYSSDFDLVLSELDH